MAAESSTFGAWIGNDDLAYPPIAKARTYVDAARTVRHLAKMGETISIYGDKGVRHFKVSFPVGVLVRVRTRLDQLKADAQVAA